MKNNKVAIYARLSREDEDKIDGNKESRSIENQIKVLSDYATQNEFEIYEVYNQIELLFDFQYFLILYCHQFCLHLL